MTMTFSELKNNISDLYRDFFLDMKIDSKTGIVDEKNLRFTRYPFIGAKYVEAPIKVLFIPLDTGKDECLETNSYHSFEDREEIFPTGMLDFNAHIAGMYATALYILKEKMGYESAWDTLWGYRDSYKIAKAIRMCKSCLPQDLMSYIAYENRFRFVTIGRGSNKKERTGGKDRIWINAEREAQLLEDEINIFAPDIIVFQGKDGLWNCNINELKKKYKVVIAYHPSCWQRKADKLQYIEEHIGTQL
ncbi:MAG: hypothetical protein II934_04385 [Prevotella sp.]|nr:hypothetical protein [Prevotella sp.]